jgi:hypothetical protein
MDRTEPSDQQQLREVPMRSVEELAASQAERIISLAALKPDSIRHRIRPALAHGLTRAGYCAEEFN